MNNLLERLKPNQQLLIGIIGAIIALILLYVMYSFNTGFIVSFVCGLFSALSFYMLVTYSFNSISKQ
ncbi:hypothetical protein [uncultured Winogradskyella sp.]|uniref:hypothetical protein n=1 Tax=uncultured Winogradskyella sp. TaxID=395353 RepID=UPI00260E5C98|nr:hypothetical protein [uncultured Winogradskyella sp.]|tara:strand:- start:169 stop:369 length:201 start_codon:yes stop_codon:yes gene_type:complete